MGAIGVTHDRFRFYFYPISFSNQVRSQQRVGRLNVAEALAVQGQLDEAIAAMDRALTVSAPDDPQRQQYSDRRDRYRSILSER